MTGDGHPSSFGMPCEGAIADVSQAGDCERAVGETMSRFGRVDTLAAAARPALKTEGTCWDAAYAALFLASDRARWVPGHILTVNGQTGPAQRSLAFVLGGF
jgi:NAD(P)-dependent dehydrogenase (short-subunit alcohol dehydrogenase family)